MQTADLLETLRRRGLTLATAESCTGGCIAHRITEVAGCSDVYLGGVVSYCNAVKHSLLGVSEETLAAVGAVSREVVEQMAAGACRATGARCGVATSGIAGPGGAVPGKPVGTVWMAWCADGRVTSRLYHFDGSRADVIRQAAAAALDGIIDVISLS